MSIANPYLFAAPVYQPLVDYNPYVFASAQAFAGSAVPVSYIPVLPTAYASAQAFAGAGIPAYTAPTYTPTLPASYANAQAFAGTGFPTSYALPSLPTPVMNAYPLPTAGMPAAAFAGATASAGAINPVTTGSTGGSSQTDELLMMLIMMLSSQMSQKPSGNNNQQPTRDTSHKSKKDEKPVPPPGIEPEITRKGRKYQFDGMNPDGTARYRLPFIGVQHGDGSRQDGIMNVNPQTGQQTVTQDVKDDPLTFDIGGDGIHTTNEKVTTNIDGQQKTVNNIGSDDAVMTLNGQIVGDKADLSSLGITEKPKDAQDALRLIAEKAFKDGVISNPTNLTDQDMETLHEKYGLSMRVGSLNAKDVSFAEAGIHGVDLSKAASQKISNFDGKGNDITQNGTTFTRADGSKGGVGDIWFKSQAA